MKCPCPRILWYWLPVILWPIGFRIAVWLLVSGSPPRWVSGNDKLLHFMYFAIMGFLVWRGFRFERRLAPWHAALAAFGVVAVYGGIDELTQQFRPSRSADIHDWFADVAGAAMPFLIAGFETLVPRKRPTTVPTICPET